MKLDYWKLVPGGKRKSFSILRRVNRGKAYKVEDERIDAINHLYHTKVQDFETCKAQLQQIIEELAGKKPERERYLEANYDLFDKYWKERYDIKFSLPQSKRSARDAFKRALSAIEPLELAAAPIHALQAKLSSLPPKKIRRVAACLNSLLTYAGRTERLQSPRRPKEDPRHLNVKDFRKAQKAMPVPWSVLAGAAFGTGCRFGELFHLPEYRKGSGLIRVEWQRTKGYVRTETKNKVSRTVPIIPEFELDLRRWLAVPDDVKRKMRHQEIGAAIVREACAHTSNTPITFHDLRHCYAIHMLTLKLSLSEVALALGDSVQVVQDYYAGYAFTDEQAEAVAKRLRKK